MMRAAVIALVAAAGCAHMNVEVAIFDAAHWSSPEYADEVATGAVVGTMVEIRRGTFDHNRAVLKARVASTLAYLRDQGAVARASVETLEASYAASVDGGFERARGGFERAYSLLVMSRRSGYTDRAVFEEALRVFATSQASLSALDTELARELRGLAPPASPDDDARDASRKAETKKVIESTVGVLHAMTRISPDTSLLDDPRASVVLYAPEERWQRTINETVCYGNFGNTDCAVKMDGIANFTIKGVRLDASKITQATFSAGTEAIRVVAAMTGPPLPAPSASASTVEPTAVEAPVNRERDAALELLRLRLARLAILDGILAERRAIEGKDQAAREAAVARIKGLFEAYRPQLAGDASQAGGDDAL